jgi:hypothetical protein
MQCKHRYTRPASRCRSGLDLVDRSPTFSRRRSLCPPGSRQWSSHTTEHGCANVDVMSMARKGVKCRRPPPSLTRVINDSRNRRARWVGPASSRRESMAALFDVEFVGSGACAHPDELPRRVMTTSPAEVDAGARTANGGCYGVQEIPYLRRWLPDAGNWWSPWLRANAFGDGRNIAWVTCARNVQTCRTVR